VSRTRNTISTTTDRVTGRLLLWVFSRSSLRLMTHWMQAWKTV
jgi:hypothetical protein